MTGGWLLGNLALLGAIVFHASQTNWPVATAIPAGFLLAASVVLGELYFD